MPLDRSLIDAEFPVNRNVIFVNHAGVSPIPGRTQRALAEFWCDIRDHGTAHMPAWYRRVEEIRGKIGDSIGAPARDIAFVSRTSEGVNIVAQGYEWQRGDNVVIPGTEYPANVYPWMNLADRGVEVRLVPETEGRFDPAEVLSFVDDRTRVLSVSFVEFASGFRHPLKTLGEACRERGVFFCVDAIQGLGVFDLDVEDMRIDAAFCGSHKWLLGPTGIAFLYVRPALRDRIGVRYVGADAVVNANDYLDYNLTLLPDARRFEYGMMNAAGIIGLGASLTLFEELGTRAIRARVRELTDHVAEGLERLGFELYGPRDEGNWSGIVSARRPDRDSGAIQAHLLANGVMAQVRAGCVRLSPHFHNSLAQMDRIVQLMKE